MQTKPFVSIVIPTYNRWDKLEKTLSELRKINYPEFELIVVDNNSRQKLEKPIRDAFSGVRYFRLSKNIGAAARNIGVKMAKGRYILMLDDDSYPEPEALDRMVEIFDSKPEIGVISFKVFLSDGSIESTGCHNVFLGCAAAFRREVFDVAGLYPEEYLYYVEEYDLSYRILENGFNVVYRSECVAHHKRDIGRKIDRIIYQLIRNNMILFAKYFPASIMFKKMRESFTRYQAIAKKENVLPSFYAGFGAGVLQASKSFLFDRQVLSARTISEVLQTEYLRDQFRQKGIRKPGQKIGLVGVGKIFSSFLQVCEEFHLEVTGIYDPNYKYYRRSRSKFKGHTVSSLEAIADDRPQVLLVSTSDLSIQAQLSEQLFKQYPFCQVYTFFN